MEISILLLTYNQEKYIKQALDSIIMQKIKVPYEIIILDDASTDNTPEILKEYKRKYSEKISLYLRKVNNGFPTRNGYFLLSKAKGRYYAVIEGDDYWIDDLKIQKQYEFLEIHQEYSACMTDLIVVDEKNNEIPLKVYERMENNIYTLQDFMHLRAPGMTVSFFARNNFDAEEYRILYKADRMMGDITTYMLCLLKGDLYQLNETMAAYRYVYLSGKNNFNSIHKGNIYREYIQVKYWIRLENFMKKYFENFQFIPMEEIIGRLTVQYHTKQCVSLMMQSKNRWKYLWVYLIYKWLLDSNQLVEINKDIPCSKEHDWKAFKKEKKRLVIFGAGMVAEEYLDKYAWQGNIFFLIDNDKSKQNTSFKGFLIKAPEELLKYKNKIKVLITNKKHESDMAEQLEKMGIQNYYCYCSMQSRRVKNIIANRLLQMGRNKKVEGV
ncbi:MAG: glycosyltransferase [Lachnospiraceae bacterium]|nr:glycosyltransferase [Lachnospiraceae bacterium]